MARMFTEAATEQLVEELFPGLAERLGEHFGLNPGGGQKIIVPSYDAYTCGVYLEPVGDNVLDNSEILFGKLAETGEVGSLELAQLVGVARPPLLSFVLTTPLKRRAKTLGVPVPWTVDTSPDNRTIWRDRDGIAARMVEAIKKEKARRAEQTA